MYVTKDKRITKSIGRKYLWWFICLALVLAIVIVAILAATGVIFKASPTTPVESRTFGDNSQKGVNVAGFFAPTNGSSSTTDLPPEEIFDSVPNAVQGQVTFQNMNFKEAYNDPKSTEFKQLTDSFIKEMKAALGIDLMDDNVTITVTDLK